MKCTSYLLSGILSLQPWLMIPPKGTSWVIRAKHMYIWLLKESSAHPDVLGENAVLPELRKTFTMKCNQILSTGENEMRSAWVSAVLVLVDPKCFQMTNEDGVQWSREKAYQQSLRCAEIILLLHTRVGSCLSYVVFSKYTAPLSWPQFLHLGDLQRGKQMCYSWCMDLDKPHGLNWCYYFHYSSGVI